MRFTLKKLRLYSCGSCALLAVPLLLATPAQAQQPGAKDRSDASISYTFSDDPLDAVAPIAWGQRIRVGCAPRRSTLIRARTEFITELLHAAEVF